MRQTTRTIRENSTEEGCLDNQPKAPDGPKEVLERDEPSPATRTTLEAFNVGGPRDCRPEVLALGIGIG